MITQHNPRLSFKSKLGENLCKCLDAVNAAYDPGNQFDRTSKAKDMDIIQAKQADKRFALLSMLEITTDKFIKGNKISKGDQVDIQAKASLIDTLPKLMQWENDLQIKSILEDILEKISGK